MKKQLLVFIVLMLSQSAVFAQSADELDSIAYSYYYKGDYKTAIYWAKKSLLKLEADHGKADTNYTNGLINTAMLYANSGDYKSAEPLYKEALDINSTILDKNNPLFAATLNSLGEFYFNTGDYKNAQPLFEQAYAIFRKLPEDSYPLITTNLDDLANLYCELSDYKNAEPLFQKDLDITGKTQGENTPYFAVCLTNLGGFYMQTAEYVKAEPLMQRAVDINKKLFGEDNPAYGANLNNLGMLYDDMGNYTKSAYYFEKALDIDRKTNGENNVDFANDLNNLATTYEETHDYSKAASLLVRVVEIKRKLLGDEHPLLAKSITNLATVYQNMGENDKAEALYNEALAMDRKILGENNLQFGGDVSNQATFYAHTNNYPKAEPLYFQSLEIYRRLFGENNRHFAETLNSLAMLYQLMGNYTKAELIYDSAQQIILGITYKNYTILSEQEKEKYNSTISDMFDSYRGFVYRNYDHLPSSIVHSFNNLLALNSLLLRSDLAMRHQIQVSHDTALQHKYIAWIDLRKKIAFASNLSMNERQKRGLQIDSLEEQANTMEKELVKMSASFSSEKEQMANYSSVRNNLGSDEAVIEFSGFEYKYAIKPTDSILYCAYIVKQGDTTPVYIPLFEEKQLQPLLAYAAQSGRGAEVSNDNSPHPDSINRKLYNLVWKKLTPYLKGINTVYITPSGLLNKISFESLQDDNGDYLLDRYQLHHLLSSSEIVKLKKEKEIPIAKSIALFGGARYDLSPDTLQQLAAKVNKSANEGVAMRGVQRNGAGFSPWPYLPGTLDEVTAINKTLSKAGWECSLNTGTAATEEQLMALSGENTPEIIHISTHGFYIPLPKDTAKKTDADGTYKLAQNPLLRSGIILSGANSKWVYDKDIPNTQNGVVTALDISNLDFTKASLVVLSACETGLGDIQSGEGVYGLQRAFRLAGVENMIISLWQVPDKETAQMMDLFYSSLRKGKTSYYDAFHKAQTKMQKQYPGEPLKWAGFELVGQ